MNESTWTLFAGQLITFCWTTHAGTTRTHTPCRDRVRTGHAWGDPFYIVCRGSSQGSSCVSWNCLQCLSRTWNIVIGIMKGYSMIPCSISLLTEFYWRNDMFTTPCVHEKTKQKECKLQAQKHMTVQDGAHLTIPLQLTSSIESLSLCEHNECDMWLM